MGKDWSVLLFAQLVFAHAALIRGVTFSGSIDYVILGFVSFGVCVSARSEMEAERLFMRSALPQYQLPSTVASYVPPALQP